MKMLATPDAHTGLTDAHTALTAYNALGVQGDVDVVEIAWDGTVVDTVDSREPASTGGRVRVAPSAEDGGHQPRPPYPPRHDLPWDLVRSRFLADGIRTGLATRRLERQYERPVGAAALPLDDAAAAALIGVEMGADVGGARDLHRAMRLIAQEGGRRVIAAQVRRDAISVYLVGVAIDPRTGSFEERRWEWTMSRSPDAVSAPPSATGMVSVPGLVSLGADANGWLLVNVHAAGGPIGVTGDPDEARAVVLAMSMELLMKRWSDRLRVVMCGFNLDISPLDPRLVCVGEVSLAVESILRFAANLRSIPGQQVGYPQFLVLAAPPTYSENELIRRELIERSEPSDVVVIVVGGTAHDSWRFTVEGGVLRSPMDPTIQVTALRLADSTAETLTRLARAEERSVLVDPRSTTPVIPIGSPEVDPATVERMIRLFGRVGLVGSEGPIAVDTRAVEVLILLALTGPASRDEIAHALFPGGVDADTLECRLEEASQSAGLRADGSPRLLSREDGRLSLVSVATDWQVFIGLYQAGRAAAAVDLLSTADFNEGPVNFESHYPYLAVAPLARAIPGFVIDVVHLVVQQGFDAGRPDSAAWAAGVGLRAQPTNQVLWDDLARALQAVRNGHFAAEALRRC